MLNNRISRIIIAVALLGCAVTALFFADSISALLPTANQPQYTQKLFDDSRVHTVDIIADNWPAFIEDAPLEEYINADLIIDGEKFENVGLRAKGNNSRRLTQQYGLARYSLKVEFDHFHDGSYYGLDKFSLDSSFQDNSYMKSVVVYDMMEFMQVPASLTSYVWVTVNGQPWGLFVAIEEPEESFAQRNFGNNYGQLYKPEYVSLADENADIDLRYIDDNFESYENIFRKAKFTPSDGEKADLIAALKALESGENLEQYINVDRVLRYFAVQVFVMNWDSYTGPTGHNYFLHQQDGRLSILPWDYNLAFGTYCLGMTNPITDPFVLINYPVNTPWEGSVMLDRPLFHTLMKNSEYFSLYHKYLDQLVSEYVENNRYQLVIRNTEQLIAPYIEQDITAFCTVEDFHLATSELMEIIAARGESVRGQLDGVYPATIALRNQNPDAGVDTANIHIAALGDFDDLTNAKTRWDRIKVEYGIE